MERLTEKGAEYSPAQTLCRAQEKDAALCAHIQRQSWRIAFRGILPEDTLDQLTALGKKRGDVFTGPDSRSDRRLAAVSGRCPPAMAFGAEPGCGDPGLGRTDLHP